MLAHIGKEEVDWKGYEQTGTSETFEKKQGQAGISKDKQRLEGTCWDKQEQAAANKYKQRKTGTSKTKQE